VLGAEPAALAPHGPPRPHDAQRALHRATGWPKLIDFGAIAVMGPSKYVVGTPAYTRAPTPRPSAPPRYRTLCASPVVNARTCRGPQRVSLEVAAVLHFVQRSSPGAERQSTMSTADAAAFGSTQPGRAVCAVVLAALAATILLLRAHTFSEPFERDLTSYSVQAHEVIEGKHLYADIPDQKPPGIQLTFALGEVLFGYRPASLHILNVLVSTLTMLGVFAATCFAGMQRATALLAAGFWTFASGSLWLQGNQPNTEVFINALLTWGFALTLRNGLGRWNLWLGLLSGVCFAGATVYKPFVVLAGAAVPLAGVLTSLRDRSALVSGVKQVLVVAATGVATWLALFGYLAVIGGLEEFLEIMFIYNRQYAGSPTGSLARGLQPEFLWPFIMRVAHALLAMSVAGLLLGWRSSRRAWAAWLAYAVATFFHVIAPAHFYPHYYQLWLPVVCLGAAWGVEAVHRRLGKRWLTAAVASCVALHVVSTELPSYSVPGEKWAEIKVVRLFPRPQQYGDIFAVTRALALQLKQILRPHETFYHWGKETGLHYYSQRRPSSGVITHLGLVGNPLAPRYSAWVLSDLSKTQPELFVLDPAQGRLDARHPVLRYFAERYVPYPTQPVKYFHVYMRKGGRVHALREPLAIGPSMR
jgi:hypothetical protein